MTVPMLLILASFQIETRTIEANVQDPGLHSDLRCTPAAISFRYIMEH